MNNFRLAGNSYISKEGNDADDGLTPDTPKATLGRYSDDNIVGSGVYKGAFSLGTSTKYTADGLVKIDCTSNLIANLSTSTLTLDATSNLIVELNDYRFAIGGAGSLFINKTVIKSGEFSYSTSNSSRQFETDDCVFKDVVFTSISDFNVIYRRTTFKNTLFLLKDKHTFENCDIDEDCTLSLTTYFTVPAFVNNNIRGTFDVGGTLYELKRDIKGNAVDPNPSVSDLAMIDPTVYDRGNFNQSAEYFDIEDAFSVTPTTFNFATSGKIGAIKTGVQQYPINAQNKFLVSDLGNYVTKKQGVSFATFTTKTIMVATIPQLITNIDLAKLLEFNSDLEEGYAPVRTGENIDIATTLNYEAGAGINPRRLTYEMRWTNNNNPTINLDWDNNGQATTGEFQTFEQGIQPMIGTVNIGNGLPEFTTGNPIVAKYIQIRVKIFNGLKQQ